MTTDDDSWLYTALAPARRLEPTDAELAPVTERVARSRRRRRRGRRTVALAVPALLVGATAAAAATGLVSVGSVIPGDGFSGDERPVVKETVLVSGVDEEVGRWRMTGFSTAQKADCLKLTLLERAARRAPGPAVSGYCGGLMPFSEFGHGRRAAAMARGEVILFGTAPAAARTVELSGDGGVRVSVQTHSGVDASRRYWLLTAPTRLRDAELHWRDRRDRAGGTLDVSHRFAGPSARTVVATGSTPAAGRWQLLAYESRRLSADGDVYSPEGLPCIELRLLDRAQVNARSGYCGIQRRTPGFTRGQSRLYRATGKVSGLIMFGRAPARADAVEVSSGGRTISAPARPAPAGIPGRFWVLARP
ncbi:MAG TPA: hypothetical protein VHF88_03820, partial [Thermoleophilaceae bacterium]|nr:hypothetical protein [Thermoleophilaceae bacterium]